MANSRAIPCCALIFAPLFAFACGGEQPAPVDETARGAPGGPSAPVETLQVVTVRDTMPRSWYRDARQADLTGDGKPDTLLLSAYGSVSDSLTIFLQVVSGGTVRFSQEWTSGDELAEERVLPGMAQVQLDQIMYRRLGSFFERSAIQPLDSAELSAAWTPAKVSDCGGDPRDCISWDLRNEAAIKTRTDSAPPTFAELSATMLAIDTMRFDTTRVRAIGEDMRLHTPVVYTFSYGANNMRVIAWSGKEKRFFVTLRCC